MAPGLDVACHAIAMTARHALVTGAARGIGAATATKLAEDGFQVLCLDLCSDIAALDYPMGTFDELSAVVDACGADAAGAVGDVRDRESLVDAIEGRTFDVVVCAAGAVWGGPPIWETPPQTWAEILAVNLDGVVNTAAVTVSAMLAANNPGRFVAIASAAADRGLPRMGAYSAAKHGVAGVIRSMAGDLAGSQITANAVSPGSTASAILNASAAIYDLADSSEFAQHHTNGRLLEPAEIANAIAWLCSDAASAVTGSVMAVDGGMTAT